MEGSESRRGGLDRGFLAAALILFLLLRLPGFTWGLPGASGHTWPYWTDEVFPFNGLKNLSPSPLDLDPDQPRGGHAYIYAIAGLVVAADAVGFVRIPRHEQELKSDPVNLARLYLLPRLLSLLCDLGTLFLVRGLARSWAAGTTAEANAGGWAAMAWAALPFAALNAHVGNYYSVVMALAAGAMLALQRGLDGSDRFAPWIAGGFIGVAASSMWLSAVLAVCTLLIPRGPSRLRLAFGVLAGASVAGALTSPYLILNPGQIRTGASTLGSQYIDLLRAPASYVTSPMHAIGGAAGLVLSTAAMAGLAVLAMKGRWLACRAPVVSLLAVIPVVSLLGSGLSRHYALAYPALAALAGLAVATIPRRIPRAALGLFLILSTGSIAAANIWPMAVSCPRAAAEFWIEVNLPAGSRIQGVNWYHIPHFDVSRYPAQMHWGDFLEDYRDSPADAIVVSDLCGVVSALEADTELRRLAVFRTQLPAILSWLISDNDPADMRTTRPIIHVFAPRDKRMPDPSSARRESVARPAP